jgi:hypothetical protein
VARVGVIIDLQPPVFPSVAAKGAANLIEDAIHSPTPQCCISGNLNGLINGNNRGISLVKHLVIATRRTLRSTRRFARFVVLVFFRMVSSMVSWFLCTPTAVAESPLGLSPEFVVGVAVPVQWNKDTDSASRLAPDTHNQFMTLLNRPCHCHSHTGSLQAPAKLRPKTARSPVLRSSETRLRGITGTENSERGA